MLRLYGLPGPGGAQLLASRLQAQSPELTRRVPASGAPSRSWDIRERPVHAAINASTPPGGPQGGANLRRAINGALHAKQLALIRYVIW